MLNAAPRSFAELSAALASATERTQIIAGGTDFVIRMRKNAFEPDMLIYPGFLPELKQICMTDSEVRIGAMVTMNMLSEYFTGQMAYSAIADAAAKVGTPQIRSKATIAGNLCNASPAGDMLPIAWLYGAEVEVFDAAGTFSRIPINQFLLGPGKNALHTGQMVTFIILPRLMNTISAFCKIGFREHVSISREGIACLLRIDGAGTVEEIRLTLGAVSDTPIRAEGAETMLRGRSFDVSLAAEAAPLIAAVVHDHCRPANRSYKTEAARGMVSDLFALLSTRIS